MAIAAADPYIITIADRSTGVGGRETGLRFPDKGQPQWNATFSTSRTGPARRT